MVLSKHYKIKAQAVAGGFALCVNAQPQVAFFGQAADGRVVTSSTGFHMWVQTETHIIDFMAPIFPEAFADTDPPLSVPRRMLQRLMATEATDLNTLVAPGDFFTLPDPELTETLIDAFLGRDMDRDLLLVAEAWFGNRRQPQKKTFQMTDSDGLIFDLSLPRTIAWGSW